MRGGCGDEGFFNDPGLAFANCGRPNFYCENFRRPADSTRRVFSMMGGLGSAPRDESGRQLRRPYSVGSFAVSKLFISAATRNCPAFFIASIRFDPGGNFLAFSSALDALASQSCLSTSPCV